ncbi:glycosyltransferase family 2 protein [Paramaledivibacter caminithermalis]|jgi:GT2 family glycosyltransferase|uniref:Glycosyltransferase 2-like domain-containing protein n=1 Tax=Paramaledivibacter caminithermalis (strain DSM 15212 / CIP 107654 / DViRD3) TaxID=1121301 RepID=A0A1M6L6D9_PARC5|nr:glycosyltransferase family 2 protein [Paramaledivibacter caminithermalis]SHJ66818.1 hypothetical protein SAMN02745912_00684 [Paramaledivibacter caminithermalis DSM 15212]
MLYPLVSIVSLCWNRKDDMYESLKRIREIEYENLEVIVVDNDSTDGTIEMIEREFPEVKLIKMYKNLGIEAYNVGFKNAKGKYIVIIDDDSFPKKDAIKKMVEKFEKDESLGIVAFDVRNFYKYDDIKKTDYEEKNGVEEREYLMSFNGAGAGIRKDLFEKVGFYPEEFFLYFNEPDVAIKVLDLGYKIKYFSDIVSYHKFSPKNRVSWRAPFYYTRNAFWFIWKNYPMKLALKTTIKLVYSCFYYSLEQKTNIYLKAMFSAFKDINRIKGKRKPVRLEIAENLRIPFYLSFTFYR